MKSRISNFMEVHPVGAELMNADGETDMMKLIGAFVTNANMPINW